MKKSLSQILKPKTLKDFVGQEHLLDEDKPLGACLKKSFVPNCFFYGPPGVGKTSLAYIMSNISDMAFFSLNATTIKIEQIRQIVSKYSQSLYKPVIFIDEVHRLNKGQQEVLLPIIEEQSAIIIGASTQNPYYSLTNALRSRSFIFEFLPLNKSHLNTILNKAIQIENIHISDEAREYLICSSNADARSMLNLLELAIKMGKEIKLENLKLIRPTSLNDGASSKSVHYDLISALIKSIRGSDENASIYYLARLIKGGENPEFIARRLVVLASEDIGNANPNALNLANSTLQAVSKIGYPEGKIILSQCVIYLACSPKSNSSYEAINKAIKYIEDGGMMAIPQNIIHNNKNYKYPHDFNGWIKQKYLDKPMTFVNLKQIGFEKTLKEWLEKIKN